jgi:hypothetical protein
LVFFLGGPLGLRGFSESPTFPIHDPAPASDSGVANPFFSAGGQYVKKSFYNFPAGRLHVRPVTSSFNDAWTPWTNGMAEFPSFYDNYSTDDKGMPFVYFVGGNNVGGHKGYNPFLAKGKGSGIGDLGGVQPYFEKFDKKLRPQNYHNADNFQIISAGKDKKFGPLGQWYNSESIQVGAGEDWKDNRSNFHSNVLGK